MATLTGQFYSFGLVGAICTVLYPFKAIEGGGRDDQGRRDAHPDGRAPLSRQLARQPRLLIVGLAPMSLGFLLQAVGTVLGL